MSFNISNSNRVTGLDVLRTLAILLVMLFHYKWFVSHNNDFGIISNNGWIGVDLFFVLSGYLISNHVFTEIKSNQFCLKRFYLKRIFKTLPNYYIVLGIYILIPGFSENPMTMPIWKYFIFVQNFNLHTSGFSQSWSLCVEEQFYLVFPFLALLIMRSFNSKVFLSFWVTIVLTGILIRYSLWQQLSSQAKLASEYTTVIYYPTYCRLDGFLCGILVSYFEINYSEFWSKFSSKSNWTLVGGIILIFGLMPILKNKSSLICTTLGYPTLSLGFAIIVVSSTCDSCILNKFKLNFFTNIARWSYAIYLIQKPVSVLLANLFSQFGLNNRNYTIIMLNLCLEIIAGYLLYVVVEKNFMNVRQRYIS